MSMNGYKKMTTNNKSKSRGHKIRFDPLDKFLTVKKLSDEIQAKIITEITELIEKNEDLKLTELCAIYVQLCFYNSKKILEDLNSLKEEESSNAFITGFYGEALLELYHNIIFLYPELDYQIILEEFNDNEVSVKEAIKEEKKVKKEKEENNIITLRQIKNIENYLKRNVIGQDDAINSLVDYVKLVGTGLVDRGSIFFVGPSGS